MPNSVYRFVKGVGLICGSRSAAKTGFQKPPAPSLSILFVKLSEDGSDFRDQNAGVAARPQ